MDFNGNTVSKMSLDEVMNTYTVSQKKALILEVYFRQRMTYSKADKSTYTKNRSSNSHFKKRYNGTFKGVCEDGAAMPYDICQYLGIKTTYTGSNDLNHSWTSIWVTDKNGVSYWHGIYTTSDSYNLKSSAPQQNKGRLTKKQVMNYTCKPNEQTHFVTVLKRASNKPATTVTTTAPTYTCLGCDATPYRHKSNTNPYISNFTKIYGDYTVYEHNCNGTIRCFDADGNEYIDINHDGDNMNELITLAG